MKVVIHKGGKGSGHFGHSGRPGEEEKQQDFSDSVIVAFNLEGNEDILKLQESLVPEEYRIDDLHLTLLFVGKMDEVDKDKLLETVQSIADTHAPIRGVFNGYGYFDQRKEFIEEKGGEGSGFHGHAGRPGKVGGSAPQIASSMDVYVGVPASRFPIGTKPQDMHGDSNKQPTGAPIRGYEVISPDDPRIGDYVYHMTTSMPGISKSGEISARGEGGLGGDKYDQIVSMTVDEDIAKQLVMDTRVYADMAKKYTGERLSFNEATSHWEVFDRNGNQIDSEEHVNNIISDMDEYSKANEGWSYKDYATVSSTYMIGDVMRDYFSARERATGVRNPIFFNATEAMEKVNSNRVGYVRIPRQNLRTGALLMNFDLGRRYGLEEVRLYGDVPLTDAVPVWKEYSDEDLCPIVLLFDSPSLVGFHSLLKSAIRDGAPLQVLVEKEDHGFTPHVTLGYIPHELIDIPSDSINYSAVFDSVYVYFGDEHIEFPFTGDIVYKQLPIDEDSITNLIEIRKAMFIDEVDAVVERMYVGEISIGQWEEQMRALIRELHASIAAIGKGGWDQMTFADWGRIGPIVKEQYRYLHAFAEKIALDRDSISLAAIKARAHMYGNAGEFSAIKIQAGDVFSKKLPWLPKDGSSECLVNCMCMWSLRVIDTVKRGGRTYNLIQATYHNRPAEHCETCIERNGKEVLIEVHESVPVPETIG